MILTCAGMTVCVEMTQYRHCEYPDGNRRRSNPPIALLYVVCTYLTILPLGSLRKPAPMTNREVGMLWLVSLSSVEG